MKSAEQSQIKVYDWVVRFFHWIFAFLFVMAFIIAKTFDDESPQYPYHMIAGFVLAFSVLLRILWGFFGTKYALFTSFKLRPEDLVSYFRGILRGAGEKYLGHNPASSWAAIIMMVCALGLAASGYLMVNGQKEELEDIHELFANLFVVMAIAHVAGVLLHTIRHKDPIGLSMITGEKISREINKGIQKTFLPAGIIFLLLVSGFGIHLYNNYDQGSQSLKLFGKIHQLGEMDGPEGSEEAEEEHD